jgi:hypothetical protein
VSTPPETTRDALPNAGRGEGWWQASDLNWYPPELHADPAHRARYVTPFEAQPSVDTLEVTEPAQHRSRPGRETGGFARSAILWGSGLVVLIGLVVAALVLAFAGNDDDEAQGETEPAGGSATGSDGSVADSGEDPAATTGVTAVGSLGRPAGFGEIWGWPDWRGGIVQVIDTTGTDLIDANADGPRPGNTDLLVIYEATYVGDGVTGFEPFVIDTTSTALLDKFACTARPEALAELGVSINRYELVPGQSSRFARCIEVASDAVGNITLTMSNVSQFDSAVVFSAAGEALPDLGDPGLIPGDRELTTQPLGTELESDDWRAAIVDVLDAQAAGLVAGFASAPLPGHVYLAVITDATYLGTEPSGFISLRVTGVGDAVYEPLNNCWLDSEALLARDIDADLTQMDPGQSGRLATCLEVPADNVGGLVVRLEDGFSFDDQGVLYPVEQ